LATSKGHVTSDTDRLQQPLMDETLPLFQRYRAMFSLRHKVNKSRTENNAFLRLQMLWRVEKDITDRLHQLLMDETLSLFQRYRAMFSLRNKVKDSRIQLKKTSDTRFYFEYFFVILTDGEDIHDILPHRISQKIIFKNTSDQS
jgi:hypothetical protein